MNSVFLTESGSGLTSTSANYIANLAQEVVQQEKTRLENVSFLSSKIITPLCPEGIDYEIANCDIDKIAETVRRVARTNALCAWIREGIKAKEALLEKVNGLDLKKWLKEQGKELPKEPELKLTTEEDVLNDLSIGDRFSYLKTEALASTFGKLIHKEMPISEARKKLLDRLVHPVEQQRSGQDLTLVRYTPAVSAEEVDNLFLKLQNEQREWEKELNGLKARVQHTLNAKVSDEQQAHARALEEYSSKIAVLNAELASYKARRREEIGKLKIVLPDSLKDIYEYLNGLGK